MYMLEKGAPYSPLFVHTHKYTRRHETSIISSMHADDFSIILANKNVVSKHGKKNLEII